ncbi:MAG TPA: phosphorylase [Sphingobium sp.]|jgi:adenosylhomocysteine nucleosidase|uniref:5'-methylthioadenosine/S-adenosylhomocysteine nucleosidase n=2 Tax=Sphingobium TaxID=165695 RepID=UPI0007F47043|nr:5'-methylthioadenosine/S-adenosylhomocysteine nucleosidase [Sphingobium sp. V4]OAN59283.1 phosphorylase [Sphingobium sp. TCM1]WIW91023.1 5'-methylthioadenosine/S-adenosylhomocysteine nucleosidase [Sphingobium sp. V4]HAF42168.1 phosphorylase [Sphingobium sp.]
MRLFALALLALVLSSPALARKADSTPRTVVMTAFLPEWDALVKSVEKPRRHQINGMTFLTGKMAGKPVLLMQSGVSMVNAAMNTQLVLDRFNVRRIVFSGIAGGVDPGLSIGDVIVPQDWAQYLEVSFARQTGEGWKAPETVDANAPANWGMMFPRGVRIGNATEPVKRHYSFSVDPAMLELAQKVASDVKLERCVQNEGARPACLPHDPKIVVGGTGVSAGVFADNAEFRDYLGSAWKARVLDMESAAVAQVAYANGVPAIVFRSLSDLAGGDAGENQMVAFMALASVNSAHVVRAFVAALPD